MLANQNLLIETMQAGHRHTESVLALLTKACAKMAVSDVETECEQLRTVLRDTDSMFSTLRDSSTADLGQVLQDVKKYAADVVSAESRELQATLSQKAQATESDVTDRFKKLESRVLSELAGGGGAEDGSGTGLSRKAGDGQLMKKVTNRISDFEAQVSSQLQMMSTDIEKKIAFLNSQPRAGAGNTGPAAGMDSYAHDLDTIKYDVSELKDMLSGTKNDSAHVKRIVLACERDMEDFTAAMDAVNVDLDEMRARVDSTHSSLPRGSALRRR
jgi:Skp family chaperone for outer membrane proteins